MINGRPLFLVCNDDGVHAPGIRILAETFRSIGDVLIVAPHVERSATSHSLSIHTPLRIEEIEPSIYAVEGTPADCVLVACRKLLTRKPNWVLSGINRGANLGIDTLYSGTVAAALEGYLHGIPSIAVSCVGRPRESYHYETAAHVVRSIVLEADKYSDALKLGVLSVNVPSCPLEELKGLRVGNLGKRLYDEHLQEGVDPRGRPYYWIGGGGDVFADLEGSDCTLVNDGYASVSVLSPSLLNTNANQDLRHRLEGPNK